MFDSSALGVLVELNLTRPEFDAVLLRHNATVVLNDSVKQSCFGEADRVYAQFKALADLGFGRFHEHISLRRLQRYERAGRTWPATPVLANPLAALFSATRNRVGFDQKARSIRAARRRFSNDVSASVQALNQGWRQSSDKHKRWVRGLVAEGRIDSALIGSPQDLVHRFLEVELGTESAEKFIATPRNYRFHIARAGLSALHAIAAQFKGEHTPYAKWLRTDRDDWNDVHLAAAAAYSTVFLTEDRSLRERCEFLYERGYVFFRSMPLSEFLKSSGGEQLSPGPVLRNGFVRLNQDQAAH